jgi:predicted ATPase
VLVDGEAGIGKTRLLEAALKAARGRGLRVAVGQAAELERTRPFGLVAGMSAAPGRRWIRGGRRSGSCWPSGRAGPAARSP